MLPKKEYFSGLAAVGVVAIVSCVGEAANLADLDPTHQDAGGGNEASAESGPAPDPAVDAGDDVVTQDSGVDAGSAYSNAVLADGPLLYLRLGEPKGSPTVFDAKGTGFGVKGNLTLGSAGALHGDTNSAADFDGASGYVNLGNTFKLAVGKDFTFEAWIKPEAFSVTRYIVAKHAGNAGFYLNIQPNGHILFYAGTMNGGAKIESAMPPGLNVYSHVVVTLTGQKANLYLNAAAEPEVTFAARPADNTALLTLGAHSNVNQFFDGLIDEVAIYDKALSAATIASHYEAATKK